MREHPVGMRLQKAHNGAWALGQRGAMVRSPTIERGPEGCREEDGHHFARHRRGKVIAMHRTPSRAALRTTHGHGSEEHVLDHLDGSEIFAPLAPDCESMKIALEAAKASVPVSIDPLVIQERHRADAAVLRAGWRPNVDSIPVVAHDEVMVDVPVRHYRPMASATSDIALVWLHGGGWIFGDIDSSDPVARTACDLTGWEVVNVDYRLAPQHPFPAAVDDSIAVTSALLDLGQRVVVGGDSAGGNLAAVVARHFAGDPRLAGQVLVYPCIDPSLSTASAQEFIDGPFATRAALEWCYLHYLAGASPQDPRVDLTGAVPPGLAPAIVLTVGHDPLRDEGIAYARGLAAAGVEVRHFHAPDSFHGAFGRSGLLPSAAADVLRVWANAVEMVG